MLDGTLLFLLGFVAFTFSTLAGGGGALLLVSTTPYLIGMDRVVQSVQLANFLGRPSRIALFWKHVHWNVVAWYVPAAWIGAWLGVKLFVSLDVRWIALIVGLFLLTTPLQFRLGRSRRSFPMKLWFFAPLGLLIAAVSSMTGATGAVLNVFYFNYGLSKESLVGTKAANSFFVAIVQLLAYQHYGAWGENIWKYGLLIGAGALLGNIAGKRLLRDFSDQNFRKLALVVMFISGLILLWRWCQG